MTTKRKTSKRLSRAKHCGAGVPPAQPPAKPNRKSASFPSRRGASGIRAPRRFIDPLRDGDGVITTMEPRTAAVPGNGTRQPSGGALRRRPPGDCGAGVPPAHPAKRSTTDDQIRGLLRRQWFTRAGDWHPEVYAKLESVVDGEHDSRLSAVLALLACLVPLGLAASQEHEVVRHYGVTMTLASVRLAARRIARVLEEIDASSRVLR